MRSLLVLLLLASTAHAAAPDVVELQRVLGTMGTAVDATHVDLPDGQRITVGRYREKPDSKWLYPVAVAPSYCDDGKPGCVRIAWLGPAAKRIGFLAYVDLEGEASLPIYPNWRELRVSGKAAKHPALALAIEREQEDPATTDVVLLSLRATKTQPASVVFEEPLETRYAEPSDEELQRHPMPAGRTVGNRIASLLVKHGKLIVTIQPIDARTNPCLQTKPYTKTFALDGGRFVEQPGTEPSSPCR